MLLSIAINNQGDFVDILTFSPRHKLRTIGIRFLLKFSNNGDLFSWRNIRKNSVRVIFIFFGYLQYLVGRETEMFSCIMSQFLSKWALTFPNSLYLLGWSLEWVKCLPFRACFHDIQCNFCHSPNLTCSGEKTRLLYLGKRCVNFPEGTDFFSFISWFIPESFQLLIMTFVCVVNLDCKLIILRMI